MAALLSFENTERYFPIARGVVRRRTVGHVRAVDGVSFAVEEGRTFALVGESGCGKTTTAKSILNVEKPTSGAVRWRGKDIREIGRAHV